MRAYLLWLAGWTVAVSLVIAAASYVGLRYNLSDLRESDLYEYQLAKIAAAGPVSTVFVGDSSLGTGIDAHYWAILDGRSATNLALIGPFGFAGSYNMIRRQLEVSRPDVIVIMQTPDMMTRRIEYEGILVTSLHFSEMLEIPLAAWARMLLNSDIPLGVARRMLRMPPDYGLQEIDFARQGPPLDMAERRAKVQRKQYTPQSIRPGKDHYLRSIADLCRREKLTCLYAHGPWYEPFCRQSPDYLAAVNETIRAAGLVVVDGTPFCATDDELGDSFEHVRLEVKRHVTEYYWRLIRAAVPVVADRTGPRS